LGVPDALIFLDLQSLCKDSSKISGLGASHFASFLPAPCLLLTTLRPDWGLTNCIFRLFEKNRDSKSTSRQILEEFVAHDFMLREDNLYLSLAVLPLQRERVGVE
jgi:hypothetical protein